MERCGLYIGEREREKGGVKGWGEVATRDGDVGPYLTDTKEGGG